jgi:hypothetical protein
LIFTTRTAPLPDAAGRLPRARCCRAHRHAVGWLLLALAKSALTVEVAHAADVSAWKVALAAAVAAASSAVHLAPPLAADITDATVYTAAFVASWGAVDLLVAGFPWPWFKFEYTPARGANDYRWVVVKYADSANPANTPVAYFMSYP